MTREGSAPVSAVTRGEACGKVMLPQGQGYRRGEQQGGRPCKPCLEPFPRLHCTEAAPGVAPPLGSAGSVGLLAAAAKLLTNPRVRGQRGGWRWLGWAAV